MVARLVHRYGVTDTVFPGARMARLGDVRQGCAALFGLKSIPGRPGHDLRSPASMALRDAAHIESPGEMVDFRRRQGREDGSILDLGNLALDNNEGHVLAKAVREIVSRGGIPIMLGGMIDDAIVCLDATLDAHPHDAARSVFISPGLEWAGPVSRMRDLVQRLALGTHDLISRADLGVWKAVGGQLLSASAFAEGDTSALEAVLESSPHYDAAAFVVVDMSSVDMGHASGASRDNVGGLDPAEFLAIVGRLALTVRLLGVAIVNLAPNRDPRGHSERLAARSLLSLLDPRLQGAVA